MVKRPGARHLRAGDDRADLAQQNAAVAEAEAALAEADATAARARTLQDSGDVGAADQSIRDGSQNGSRARPQAAKAARDNASSRRLHPRRGPDDGVISGAGRRGAVVGSGQGCSA